MGCTSSKSAATTSSSKKPDMDGRKGVGHTERMGTNARNSRKGIGATERLPRSSKTRGSSSPDENCDDNEPPHPELDENGNLMPEEVLKRISNSKKPQYIVIGDVDNGKENELIQVQYAYLSQRGFYPDDPHKENQDDFSITNKLGSKEGDSLFAVYDGHGKFGGSCASFAKEHYPKILQKNLRQERAKQLKLKMEKEGGGSTKGAFNPKKWPMLSQEQYESVCVRSHRACNKAMHKDSKVDDALSGTTIISAAFHFGRVTVCNVGDSRAVIGRRIRQRQPGDAEAEEEKEEVEEMNEADIIPTTLEDSVELAAKQEEKKQDPANATVEDDFKGLVGEIVAIPLSQDQTPYREDERERVKKAGAKVMSIDQMEGIEPMHENWDKVIAGEDIDEKGDPPRIWIADTDYPGTAFTRSIGDTVAEDIGVHCDPEMVTFDVTEDDEILVIASDGVFEFLTNQTVIDICAECKDPLEACKKVVAASYKQWLHYENRTDDITVIVLFLDSSKSVCRKTDKVAKLFRESKRQNQLLRNAARPSVTGAFTDEDPALVRNEQAEEEKPEKSPDKDVRPSVIGGFMDEDPALVKDQQGEEEKPKDEEGAGEAVPQSKIETVRSSRVLMNGSALDQ